MESNLTESIIKSAKEIFKNDIKYLYLLDKVEINNFMKNLNEFYKNYEDTIKDDHDDKHNMLCSFSIECAKSIVDNNNEFMQVSGEIREKLFRHRYLGYAFYYLKYMDEIIEFLDSNKDYANILYCSMVEYFCEYFGSFADNEMAIVMICRNYSKEFNFKKKDKRKLVQALYSHCSNAGEGTDIGFAYGGINKIKKYFKLVPKEIVFRVMESYGTSMVVNNHTYRKQIYTMIASGDFTEKEKRKLKFRFIDSIILAEQICIEFGRAFRDFYDYQYTPNSTIGQRSNCKFVSKRDEEKVYLTSSQKGKVLKSNNKVYFEVKLTSNKIVIKSYMPKTIKFKYHKDKYMLNEYFSGSVFDRLKDLFSTEGVDETINQFLFSHIWIDNYRKINDMQLSFDNKFKVEVYSEEMKISKQSSTVIPENFFGNSIYSVSAIIGKNGTGKTSIIEYLRDRFFYELDHVDKYGELRGNNKGNSEKFLVIFHINSKSYFLSNFKNIKYNPNEIIPYEGYGLKRESENSRIFYFSNMINPDVTNLNPIKVNNAGEMFLEAVKKTRFIDYSENESFKLKNNEYNLYLEDVKNKIAPSGSSHSYVNRDFWYKITFLNQIKDDDLKELLGSNISKKDIKFKCFYTKFGDEAKGLFLQERNDLFDKLSDLNHKKFIYSVYELGNLSAGQYAKLSFLSKLYWCLDGYDKYHEKIEKIIGENTFFVGNTIINNSTAIIFIDEGEAYYHPEWQREYMNILIDFIEKYTKDKNVKIQIILTSNSPFIISDIPASNIMLMNKEAESNKSRTFAANIHTMLKSDFFMESTVGEFSKKKVNEVFDKLSDIEKHENKSVYFSEREDIKTTIDMIGDELIRYKLSKLYDKCFLNNKDENVESIRNQLFHLISNKEDLEAINNILDKHLTDSGNRGNKK